MNIDHDLLPNSLITGDGLTTTATYDIMGLDSAVTPDPTKLIGGSANLYASNTETE